MNPPDTPSSELAHLVEDHLADALATGRSRGTIAYRRVYLSQLLAWLEARAIVRARLVTPRVLGDYLVYLTTRETNYNRAEPTTLSVKTLAAEASVLRSFFRWLAARRVVLFDPAEHLALGDRTQPLPKAIPFLGCAAIVCLCACSAGHETPVRPGPVPPDAAWAGGSKGGAWIKCGVDPSENLNSCTIYYESSGSVWKSGKFVLRGSNRAAGKDELVYVDFDGRQVYLKNGGVLVAVDTATN